MCIDVKIAKREHALFPQYYQYTIGLEIADVVNYKTQDRNCSYKSVQFEVQVMRKKEKQNKTNKHHKGQ